MTSTIKTNVVRKDQMEHYLTDAGWKLPSVIEIDVDECYYGNAVGELKDKRKTLNKLRFVAKQTDDSRRILIPYVQAYEDLLSSIERVVKLTLTHGNIDKIDSDKLNLPDLAYADDEEEEEDDEVDEDD